MTVAERELKPGRLQTLTTWKSWWSKESGSKSIDDFHHSMEKIKRALGSIIQFRCIDILLEDYKESKRMAKDREYVLGKAISWASGEEDGLEEMIPSQSNLKSCNNRIIK